MHINGPNETPDNKPLAAIPLRTMCQLPHKKTVELDIKKPSGVPLSALRAILDANTRRTRFAEIGRYWSEADDANLLLRLAGLRAPTRQPYSDPILWLFRTRLAIRKATLSHVDLQHDEKPSTDLGYPQEMGSTVYKSLASWACRCWNYNPEIDTLCKRLHDEIRSPSGSTFYPISDPATCHRILWYSSRTNYSREKVFDTAVETRLFQNRGS